MSASCNDCPCADALVAGTVALMTSWADPTAGNALDAACQRSLLARKIVDNLGRLGAHPQLSPALRRVMAAAQQRWQAVLQPGAELQLLPPLGSAEHWH